MQLSNDSVKEAALQYLQRGFSIIPVGQDKKPLISWKKYQNEKASEKEVKKWFRQHPDANVGIVTGAISGIMVVDVERDGDTSDLPATVISKTGGRGFHYYYYHPGYEVKNAVRIRDEMDIRGDGGYVVAPPSIHSSGNEYEWLASPYDADMVEPPEWILKACTGDERLSPTDWEVLINTDTPEGERNTTAARIAGKLLREIPQALWEVKGWAGLKTWNEGRCKPPLAEEELRTVWESIKSREVARNREERANSDTFLNQSDKILRIIDELTNDITLFHDQTNEPYAQIPIETHKEIWQCKSKFFKRWIANIYWEYYGRVPSVTSVTSAINTLEGRACFDGERHDLATRVSGSENTMWYDLSDEKWRAVKISPEGWSLVDEPPMIFKRYTHQTPQVEPVKGGDVKTFLNYVNVKDEQHKLLVLVYMISSFVPDIPHPVLMVHGTQGSAKSSLALAMRKIVDPSVLSSAEFPSSSKEFAQKLAHHWFCCFDNVSGIPAWISDTLCKAVTGGGFTKRQLFTDEDDVIFTFKRCVTINGINLAANKSDLLERSIVLELERVPEKQRRQERELWREFENQRPHILGGVFDTLVKAMSIKPSITLHSLPRMADFTVWGCAIAVALGHTQDEFMLAYQANIMGQNEEALQQSLIAITVRAMMEKTSEWEGSASRLLKELTAIATKQGIDVNQEHEWPRAANVLSRHLIEIKTNLEADGIRIARFSRDKKRLLQLKKIEKQSLLSPEPRELTPKNESRSDGNDKND